MKAKKVIFMLPNLGAGGAERVVTILSRGLREKGLAVDIVMMLSELVQYPVPDGVGLVSLRTQGMSQLARLRVVRDYFRKQKKEFQNVVAVPFQDNCLNYALAASVGLGIPVVACERNNPYRKGREGLARRKAIAPYALAKRCVFQTPDAQDYYGPAVGRKSTVILNPLTLPDTLRWRGRGSRRILSVGRLDPQKNQKILIEAFAGLHEKFPEYTLEIYGEGALRPQLQAQIDSLGLEKAVFLRGHCPDIPGELVQAAMFVLPSDYEGMSNALMEALAVGMPVVTTDHPIGGARMLVENGVSGLMTPVGDAQALQTAMERLLREPGLARSLGENAVRVREKLAVDTILRQWMDVINL